VHWTILAALWAGVGPLVGVLIGAYLTNHIQRRLWLADHKRQEYQELFAVMTNAFTKLLELNNTGSLTVTELNTIQVQVVNMLHSRLFTSDVVFVDIDLFQEWNKAIEKLKAGEAKEFSGMIGGLLEDIRQVALKDLAR